MMRMSDTLAVEVIIDIGVLTLVVVVCRQTPDAGRGTVIEDQHGLGARRQRTYLEVSLMDRTVTPVMILGVTV